MSVNQILPFCPTDLGTNLLTQVEYAAATDRTNGNQPGIASSKLNNKAIRQSAFITSQFAQFISDKLSVDVLDDGDTAALLAQIISALTPSQNIKSKSANYSAVINDYVLCSGASWTLTLPTAVGQSGKTIAIRHDGTSITQVYTINTTSAQTISGIASGAYALYTFGETLIVVSDGTNWQIESHYAQTDWSATAAPTITGSTSGTFTVGTNSRNIIKWKREGNLARVVLYIVQTGAGSNGVGNALVLMPGGLTVDTTDSGVYTGTTPSLAYPHWLAGVFGAEFAGGNGANGSAYMYDSTHFALAGDYQGANTMIWGSATGGLTNADTILRAEFVASISGWKP